MGYTLTIDRRDRRPLGTVAEVQGKLEKVFVGIQFAVQHAPPDLSSLPLNKGVFVYGKKPGLTSWLVYQIMRRITPPLRYPYVTGDFQGDGFAIEFQFGPHPLIQRLPIDVYGAASIDQQMMQLTDLTGWRVPRTRVLDAFVR